MHGRVKVKTTAQQEAEKRLEREKKLALYKAATGKIFQKREQLELDDELLQITAQVLQNNPDDATLWNIRREIFLDMKAKGDSVEDRTKDELMLVQQTLMKNPKSYGAWWHRGWVNENLTSTPDWSRELQLTGLFLEKDDRNFHCWDYRRFVLQRCSVPLEDELKFTRERIDANFSNYSSWHYRSRLLPQLFPGEEASTIREDVLLEELDLVLNAGFTDPQDQSAWMYHRWLLGKVEPKENLIFAKWDIVEGVLLVTFGREVSHCGVHVKCGDDALNLEWERVGGQRSAYVWSAKHEALKSAESISINEISLMRSTPVWRSEEKAKGDLLTAAKTTVLQEQLENARQLVEIEPDSKWPLLTTALLMNALQDPQYAGETLTVLDSLTKVDPYRKNYYADLRSKLLIEAHLEPNAEEVDLSNKGLTCLRHCHLMSATVKLNLSENRLRDPFLRQLRHCARLKTLILDSNPLGRLDFLSVLPELKTLSIRNCGLQDVSGLVYCKKLEEVLVAAEETPDILEAIKRAAPTAIVRASDQ